MASALGDAVVGVRVVNASAVPFWASPQQLALLRTNLGALGVVTAIELAVIPQYDLQVECSYQDADWLFGAAMKWASKQKLILSRADDPFSQSLIAKQVDYFYAAWYPYVDKVIVRTG